MEPSNHSNHSVVAYLPAGRAGHVSVCSVRRTCLFCASGLHLQCRSVPGSLKLLSSFPSSLHCNLDLLFPTVSLFPLGQKCPLARASPILPNTTTTHLQTFAANPPSYFAACRAHIWPVSQVLDAPPSPLSAIIVKSMKPKLVQDDGVRDCTHPVSASRYEAQHGRYRVCP